MKTIVSLLFVGGYLRFSLAFMTVQEFDSMGLKECYNDKHSVTTTELVNGQVQPLPNSIETFVSIVEKIESKYPSYKAVDIIQNLLLNFRVDGLQPDFRNWPSAAKYANDFERAFFNLDSTKYLWKHEDFTNDEKCALHFMLSHSVNTTSEGNGDDILEDGTIRRPREYGVVSLHSKWEHAFALNKVLLGILAGLSGDNVKSAKDIYQKINRKADATLTDKVNRLYAVTIGDIVSNYVNKHYKKAEKVTFLPNGVWNDLTCPTHYILNENNKKYVSNSVIRGAMDGLILGLKLEERREFYNSVKLSQILRMYYGSTGLLADNDVSTKSETQWCHRYRNLPRDIIRDEVVNFYKLYVRHTGGLFLNETSVEEIKDVLSSMEDDEIIKKMNDESCESSSQSAEKEKRFTQPHDIFAILDWTTPDPQKNVQIEIIGNLSVSFNVRRGGNSVGVYTNIPPLTTNKRGLDTITNNSGIAGCQSCFAKYYGRRTQQKISEKDVFKKLNETLTEFVEKYDIAQNFRSDVKSGVPAKIVLFFSYGNTVVDYELKEALWEIQSSFREVTILSIGTSKDNLKVFSQNDDTDIEILPSSTVDAAGIAAKLKKRILKVPAEFQFKQCNRSSRATEGDNKQQGIVGVNKKQYWAMYPKYFLKSFSYSLKFKAQNGAQIKVCFSRYYSTIIEENSQGATCWESGDEIAFPEKNPCKWYDAHTCHPFYFSIEGKKAPTTACEGSRCNTPRDIQFDFYHEGLSCNKASLSSVSCLAILLAVFYFCRNIIV